MKVVFNRFAETDIKQYSLSIIYVSNNERENKTKASKSIYTNTSDL